MKNRTAIIIDDNLNNLLVLEQLLKIEEFTTITLSSTEDLNTTLDTIDSIDLIFLDLEIPQINGFEALRIIKSKESLSNAKVVAYSVHVNEMNEAIAEGFDAFLGKPISSEEFSDQLTRILQGEQVRYIP